MVDLPGMRPVSRKRFRKVMRGGHGVSRLPRDFMHAKPVRVAKPKVKALPPRLDQYGIGDIVELVADAGALEYGAGPPPCAHRRPMICRRTPTMRALPGNDLPSLAGRLMCLLRGSATLAPRGMKTPPWSFCI
jgi:hypothetical protein